MTEYAAFARTFLTRDVAACPWSTAGQAEVLSDPHCLVVHDPARLERADIPCDVGSVVRQGHPSSEAGKAHCTQSYSRIENRTCPLS